MHIYQIVKNNKLIDTVPIHDQCIGTITTTLDTIYIKCNKVEQPRAKCFICSKLNNPIAAKKQMEKRELEKPLRDLNKLRIVKNGKLLDLVQGEEILLSETTFQDINTYVLKEFKPTPKIKTRFEAMLFTKLTNKK